MLLVPSSHQNIGCGDTVPPETLAKNQCMYQK